MDEIESFKAMEYSPLKEYGGWGIKYGFIEKAYNVYANKEAKLFLKMELILCLAAKNTKN
jgi:hypothetical protein